MAVLSSSAYELTRYVDYRQVLLVQIRICASSTERRNLLRLVVNDAFAGRRSVCTETSITMTRVSSILAATIHMRLANVAHIRWIVRRMIRCTLTGFLAISFSGMFAVLPHIMVLQWGR
ncbi:hypothetical protein F441_19923 [Phytophthora nicotianae CJ01A1]|uniref:Uncharacterized protein n=4 Tax=Phytophthora nicotianae TaxID=4792 RepID=V9E2R8_PHYNI|nr:hypothetical protein F443_20049 [Phytophthora nicotianae P1569]ETK73591.1 hypothetical protein L915_19500 [Phytophthora nicotianae]ETM33509.1 hypothetical protein L914_19273 [Phytophthora nicotianae]ETP03077.1 hypothetical protein F441_19923 [Phytophthora nicotianae CJ01A1]ETP31256.1 hypothetical protein F442_19863 [Phytophthora nicotianae P10297]